MVNSPIVTMVGRVMEDTNTIALYKIGRSLKERHGRSSKGRHGAFINGIIHFYDPQKSS